MFSKDLDLSSGRATLHRFGIDFLICSFIVFIFFLLLFAPPNDLQHLSRGQRMEYLRTASVWHKTNIPATNLFLGPQNEISVPPEAEVSCVYVEEVPSKVGFTPKFKCRLLDSGEIVRIKFSRRETVAEVAGTRLLWALGFYTDEVYRVRLRCYGCPEKNPANPSRNEARIERMISDAMMERNFPGSEIAQYPDQGWSWKEFEQLAAASNPPKRAELDALKLLAAFMQHTDSKRSQQRLGCVSANLIWNNGRLHCAQPLLMIQDLGETFGEGSSTIDSSSAMYYKGWSAVPVWDVTKEMEERKKNSTSNSCFANLISTGNDGLFDPEISEEGRAFLSELLNQLSDQQIRDLFRASRSETTGEKILENGNLAPVTIDHWLAAFKKKRKEIADKRCE